MRKICKCCLKPFEGVYNQKWCHKPQCEEARKEADRQSQIRKRKKAPTPICRHCKQQFDRVKTSRSEWCPNSQCQQAKGEYFVALRRKHDKRKRIHAQYIPSETFIAPGERISKCIECGQPTPNRFGRCTTCNKRYLRNIGYDVIYEDPNLFSACYS